MQKRLVRKLDLEFALSKIEPHPSPKAELEQYTITPEVAAEILYLAAYTYGDIIGKTIADLGCGTGRLAIGSALLGAKEVVGVDIDRTATRTALKNAEKLGVKARTCWITADIKTVRGKFNTVLQNPPFGVQRRKADRKFLENALKIGQHVYSLHKSSREKPRTTKKRKKRRYGLLPSFHSSFLKSLIRKNGGQIKAIYTMPITIQHIFNFHRKRKHLFLVDLYVIESKQEP